MNEQLFRTLLKRYEAVIEDCMYKIQSLNENNIIESELRKDIIFNISGLTSILNPNNSHDQIIFI